MSRSQLAGYDPMREPTERYLQEVSSRLNDRRKTILENHSEALYRDIFEQLPVSIWVEDWSAVKFEIDRLKRRGVKNWLAYLRRRPKIAAELIDAIVVTDVSEATVDIYRANCKADVVVSTLAARMTPQELAASCQMIAAFAGGAVRFEIETEEQTLGGEPVTTHTRAVIPPDYHDTWSRVLYVINDISKLAHAESHAAAVYAQFVDAIESVTDGFCLFDAAGRLVMCNEMYRTLHGYKAAETEPGVATYDSLGALDVARGDGSTKSLSFAVRLDKLRHGESLRIERTVAGRVIERRQHVTSSGGIISIQSDITERKQAEEALRESERRYANAQRITGLGHWLWDEVEHCILTYSDQLPRIFGVERDAFPSTADDWFAFIHPDDRDDAVAEIQRSVSDRQGYDLEYRIVRRDGEVRFVRDISEPLFDDEDRFIRTLGTIQDITNQRRADAAVSESDARYRALVETSPFGIWEEDYSAVKRLIDRLRRKGVRDIRRYLDKHRDVLLETVAEITLLDVNEAGWRIFRANSKEELLRFDADFSSWQNNSWADYYIKEIAGLADGDGHFVGEFTEEALDGSEIEVRCILNVLEGHEDTWDRVITTIEDITNRRQVEAALKMTRFSVDQAALSIFWIAPDGRFIYVNQYACDELGYSRDELLTMGVTDIGVDVDDGELARHWKSLKKDGSISFEARHRTKDGRIIPVWVNTNYMAYGGHEYDFCFTQDIAERKRADEALRHSEEQLQSMAANVPGAVFRRVLKADGTVEYPYVSERHRELFGIDPDDLMADASRFEKYVHADDYPHWEEALRLSAESLATQEIEMRLITGKEAEVWVQSIAQPRRLENGDVVWDGIILDITDRKEAERKIDYLAHHDVLTDLPNRALFQDRLAAAIAQAQRHGKLLAVHFLDLNRFKEVNDSLGHPVGDELLRAVAADLKRVVRATDTVARLGGDEFAVIETELDSPQGAVVLAQKVIETLSQPYKLGEHEVRTGTTIGIAVYPNDGTSPEDLLQNADFALYAGKAKGRDGFEVFDPDMSAALKASKELEVELHRAIENNEFILHYQPRIALSTGAIIGAEALVRWMHPERGMVSPGDFIPVAESSGLVRPIGEWVLRTACIEANSWQRAGLPPLSVAVNLSAAQFHGTDIVATVCDVLDESLLDPTLLELEITETMMMRERDSKVVPTLQSLSDLGVEISVDDFGTGYASLTYLRRFPVSKVKVDQSFVAGIVDDRDDRAIVQAVIGLGRGLNMSVTAEGVETREQVEMLKSWDCDEAQGYYFGRPVPADDLVDLLKTGLSALA